MCVIGDFVEMRDVSADKPLTAYRFWRSGLKPLRARRKALPPWKLGKVKRAHMRPGPRATCYPIGIAPPRDAVAGLWAFNRMFRAKIERRERIGERGGPIGKVRLWGRVAVHEYGYRAQYARIVYAR